MQAAVLLLGHTFPLEDCLSGHLFIQFIQFVHLSLYAQLESPSVEEDPGSCSEEKEEGNQQEDEDVSIHLDDPPSCSQFKKHLGQVDSAHIFTGYININVWYVCMPMRAKRCKLLTLCLGPSPRPVLGFVLSCLTLLDV